ncbi:DUF4136 domain-containing protein [Sphingomicrobium sediminis]|uniref:DUF4136 domain-containing protein n=1 Tax=Sphingomicrobium sediminis TaxID=2950949 RepID=A0A9X2EGI2_9SPHN|nr:DUF4136 domain-containing protein [Sphingomicrobium sediminis]MCM8557075.1 DUF4136 domain-containing protein [Sphingomicrobium sediminis]
MTPKFRNMMTAAAALALAGCATGFDTKVSRFQNMPAPEGQTFAIVPADQENDGSLEFNVYADMVAAEMAEEGYVEASDLASADLIVQLGYGVDDGQRVVVDQDPFGYRRRAFYARYGGLWGRPYYRYYRPRYYRGSRVGFYFGWDDPFWYGRDLRVYTEYRSALDIDIRRADTNEAVFEGTAKARSRTDELGTLVPNLITAMFTDFPGNSGETVKITVKEEESED